MSILKEEEIDLVCRKLQKSGLKDSPWQAEVTDHICCMIEEKMAQGLSFELSLQETWDLFGVKEINRLQKEAQKQNSLLQKLQKLLKVEYGTVMGLLLILVIISRNSNAQGHPDIAPLHSQPVIYAQMTEETRPGIRFEVRKGTPVIATASGKIGKIDSQSLTIKHSEGLETFYSHLDVVTQEEGVWVDKGEIIGYVASESKNSSQSYLYYEISFQGKKMNPLDFFED